MTIVAIFVQPDLIVAATDSATFLDGKQHGHAAKLVTNATICAIGAGRGNMALLRDAAEAVCTATDFDALPGRVSKALRSSAISNATAIDADPKRYSSNLYAIGGWSPKAGRMLLWRFSSAEFFAPIVGSSLVSPEVPDMQPAWFPPMQRDVVKLARDQAAILEEDTPNAGDGTLVIAELRPGTISTRAIPDYFAKELPHVH